MADQTTTFTTSEDNLEELAVHTEELLNLVVHMADHMVAEGKVVPALAAFTA